jgi:hypothetical protein
MNTVTCLQFQDINVFFPWALTNCRSNLSVTRPGIASTHGQPWAKRRIQELSWGPQSLIILQLLHFYFNLYMSHGSKLNSVSKGVYWPCTSCKHNTGSICIPESFSCVPATFLRMLLLPSFPSIRQQRHEIMKLELDSSYQKAVKKWWKLYSYAVQQKPSSTRPRVKHRWHTKSQHFHISHSIRLLAFTRTYAHFHLTLTWIEVRDGPITRLERFQIQHYISQQKSDLNTKTTQKRLRSSVNCEQ